MDQFGKVLKISDESNFEDMPVLVTSTTNLEEQLQELQRKLIEKEAEIVALAAQCIGNNIPYILFWRVGLCFCGLLLRGVFKGPCLGEVPCHQKLI